MIDFNALLNAAFEAAIEAKLVPIREHLKVLQTHGLSSVVRVVDGDVVLTAEIEGLVDIRIEHFLEKHNEDYDHDDFVTESDLDSKIKGIFEDDFQSRVETAIDGLRVTLNT